MYRKHWPGTVLNSCRFEGPDAVPRASTRPKNPVEIRITPPLTSWDPTLCLEPAARPRNPASFLYMRSLTGRLVVQQVRCIEGSHVPELIEKGDQSYITSCYML